MDYRTVIVTHPLAFRCKERLKRIKYVLLSAKILARQLTMLQLGRESSKLWRDVPASIVICVV